MGCLVVWFLRSAGLYPYLHWTSPLSDMNIGHMGSLRILSLLWILDTLYVGLTKSGKISVCCCFLSIPGLSVLPGSAMRRILLDSIAVRLVFLSARIVLENTNLPLTFLILVPWLGVPCMLLCLGLFYSSMFRMLFRSSVSFGLALGLCIVLRRCAS